ncbi:MAG: DUF2239 family protein [Nitrosospira sp.]
MNSSFPKIYIAFAGNKRIAHGSLSDVARGVKRVVDQYPSPAVSVFDADSSEPVELDLRGTLEEVLSRLPLEPAEEEDGVSVSGAGVHPRRTPGRPRLGVTAREVTLLPRHWEWLAGQPGGTSVALRKLVEHARRSAESEDRIRQLRESAYRFMLAMAGNEPGFEEAARALFAVRAERFDTAIAGWPADIREHTKKVAEPVFNAGQ